MAVKIAFISKDMKKTLLANADASNMGEKLKLALNAFEGAGYLGSDIICFIAESDDPAVLEKVKFKFDTLDALIP